MLTDTSTQFADLVEAIAPSVVQVRAGGRAASGIVYQPGLVLTTGRVVGRDEHPEVRGSDNRSVNAELAGWDPASRLVLLSVPELAAPSAGGSAARHAPSRGRRNGAGTCARGQHRDRDRAIAEQQRDRASAGIVAIIGGPLPTGPRRQLDRVIRISAPLHDGFAGGAVVGADGSLTGIATAAAIRGLTVVIPPTLRGPRRRR
jgi:S1-C subfamily serine protease